MLLLTDAERASIERIADVLTREAEGCDARGEHMALVWHAWRDHLSNLTSDADVLPLAR